uniref:Protein kinase domain-containing protein n=1 Tax=Panagrolaimus sp. JU765 TaxID=591449 RepID=A0AC34QG93_9BILA
MQYIPPGFWSRLITRILDDEKITQTIGKLFVVQSNDGTPLNTERRRSSSPKFENFTEPLIQNLADSINKEGFEFLLWKTGLEVDAFGTFLLSLKQFLPLANVRDVNYSISDLKKKSEDGIWRNFNLEQASLIELLIPNISIRIQFPDGTEYLLEQDRTIATRLLAVVVNVIDDLLEDWFPALGTRFVHTSEGRLLIDRLIPCPECAINEYNHLKSQKSVEMDDYDQHHILKTPPRSQTLDNFVNFTKSSIYLFTVEECILAARGTPFSDTKNDLICPKHEMINIEEISPDVIFYDLNSELSLSEESIKRGKLMGRGAFGFVFDGYVKKKENEIFSEVALKILEPVEPGINSNDSAKAAFEAFIIKWKNDALENCARSYCTARQELNMLADLNHQNVTSLIGFCSKPLTIAVELAPFGSLDQILSKYRRFDSRLSIDCLQQTCIQIAKALEYLHQNKIIYRDLKSENVLVWRFPLPRSYSTVQVKLGDYGISRYSYPSGVCKGYGGTEGFMAPEIMRSNGENEYNEK